MEPNPYEPPRVPSEPLDDKGRAKLLGVNVMFLIEIAALIFFLLVMPFCILPSLSRLLSELYNR
jgi:hypothetical protein